MFDAAARHLNFRLAAREVNVTQGAVAQQVRRLEADLGCKLFRRKARGLELTDIGRSYFGPVRRALAIIDDATDKLRPQGATLKISVTPSFAAKWLVPRLSAFEQANPGIDVQTVATEGLADFRTDSVDLAIRQGEPPTSDGVRVEFLAPLDLCAVCSPGYAETIGPVRQFADLTIHRLLHDGHNHWARLLEEAGLGTQTGHVQFNQTALAIEAAMNGQGIALVPWLLAEGDIARGKLAEVWRDSRSGSNGYYMISPQLQNAKPATHTMIEWCKLQVGTRARSG
ncbi:MAG: LysR family transcriptional regulator [Rhizobiales bacterium]|nr:LysR family transcriptional regulator [Hyphomicrobiales bacterium]